MRALVAGVLVGLVLGAHPAPARANGGTVRVAKVPAGPYLVSVWTQPEPPRVGRVDVSVAVMRPETKAPVLDATVHVRAGRPDPAGLPLISDLVRGAGDNPLYYHALLEVRVAGPWRVSVEVEGPAGTGRAAFELDVQPARSPAWTLVPAFLLGLGGPVVGRPLVAASGAGRRAPDSRRAVGSAVT